MWIMANYTTAYNTDYISQMEVSDNKIVASYNNDFITLKSYSDNKQAAKAFQELLIAFDEKHKVWWI